MPLRVLRLHVAAMVSALNAVRLATFNAARHIGGFQVQRVLLGLRVEFVAAWSARPAYFCRDVAISRTLVVFVMRCPSV
jgi:hypothetical protein